MGRVFFAHEGKKKPKEREKLAGVLAGAVRDAGWNEAPAPYDFFDGKGTSLLLVHSEKGERLRARIAPALRMTATDLDRALAANPAADRSVACPPGRTAFFAALDSRTIAEQADILCRDSAATKAKNLLRRAVNKLRG